MFFNEIDPYAADWLRNLWPGAEIDERSIADVVGKDVETLDRCHFFAGIGGWEYALQLAGWPDDAPVWTGSCPCQPFSIAGARKKEKDARHVWPEFRRLISECRPAVIFGEQVASKDGREWLSGVRTDLEALGYAVGAADLCAAGAGAPHIRQRLYWVANSGCLRLGPRSISGSEQDSQGRARRPTPNGCEAGGLAHSAGARHSGARQGATVDRDGADSMPQRGLALAEPARHRTASRLANAGRQRRQQIAGGPSCDEETDGGTRRERCKSNGDYIAAGDGEDGRMAYANDDDRGSDLSQRQAKGGTFDGGPGAWSGFDLIRCRDGKARRIESGSFPLAYGVPNRVGKLRAYGNAIVPQVAATFIEAFLESNG